jgi:hypothetical protein
MEGEFEGINERTGDKLHIKFTPKSYRSAGTVSGTCWDGQGNKMWTISGQQADEVHITDHNGNKELIYKSPLFTKEDSRQYNFTHFSK